MRQSHPATGKLGQRRVRAERHRSRFDIVLDLKLALLSMTTMNSNINGTSSNQNSGTGKHSGNGIWWGRHGIDRDRMGFWQIGPLQLNIQNLEHEWRLSWERGHDFLDNSVHIIPSLALEAAGVDAEHARFAYRESLNELVFSPALADRAVVTKFEQPIRILPAEEVTVYVCTPLWLRVEMIQPAHTLVDLPIFRPSDTWFGPTPTVGELCYASRTPAFFQMRDVPLRSHLATTAVLLRNRGRDSLLIDRLTLPLPRLSLFHSARTGFWTEQVVLESQNSNDLASMKLEKTPPQAAAPHQFVSGSRLRSDEPVAVVRAFSHLMKEKGKR